MLYQLLSPPVIKNRGIISKSTIAYTDNAGKELKIPSVASYIRFETGEVLVEICGGKAIGLYLAETSSNSDEINEFLGNKLLVGSRSEAIINYLGRNKSTTR